MPYPAKTSPEAILETALELLEQEGQANLSMRNLAQQLDLKAPSLYRYYADKKALEVAMVGYATDLLRQQIESGIEGLVPRKALKKAAEIYLEFTRAHPNLYALTMNASRFPYHPSGTGKALWNVLLAVVGRVTKNPDDTAATVALWAFLHGFANLEHSGMFGPSGPKGGFEVGLSALLEGFKTRAT
ncbi:MAG: TetR/AcrR family transcriptional regulator [Thermaceae bacterium]|nr:TetR/AcrR family transcriptional regulator [Thermaceae bacterium]